MNMSDNTESKSEKPNTNVAGRKTLSFKSGSEDLLTEVIADWMPLHIDDKPAADMFYTAYLVKDKDPQRPITFCINGGPGGSSVFLQFACAGPRILAFDEEGHEVSGSKSLVDNPSHWLGATDLVFIDAMGTGYSRLRPEDKKDGEKPAEKKDNPYWAVKKDLASIAEFMRKFLTEHTRWQSPLFFAGESYGGYRAGRLAKLFTKEFQLVVNGLIIISPIWQFRDVSNSDYSSSQWINQLPVYVGIAHKHGLCRHVESDAPMNDVLLAAENFAISDFARALVAGTMMADEERHKIFTLAADMMGLDARFVIESEGRVSLDDFARELKRHAHQITDLYDGSLSAGDTFPNRTNNEDAIGDSLFNTMNLYAAAVYQWQRGELGLKTELEYAVLNMEANKAWKNDEKEDDISHLTESMDDFRAGMNINPAMKSLIVHGQYDTVTPYFASKRLMHQSRLKPQVKDRITEVLYEGGHMFYSWHEQRKRFSDDVKAFIQSFPK
jgi:carboxypeptidase C (cathepsin A)